MGHLYIDIIHKKKNMLLDDFHVSWNRNQFLESKIISCNITKLDIILETNFLFGF